MNILCVEQFSNLGGGQRTLMDLLPAFLARGWRTEVALPRQGAFSDGLRRLGCPTYYLKCNEYTSIRKPVREMANYLRELPRLAREIEHVVSRWPVDLIYVNGPRFLPPAAWVARRRSVPIIFHCHCRLSQKAAIRLAGESLRWSQAEVVACCRHVAEPLKAYVRQERLRVLYNGVVTQSRPFSARLDTVCRIGVLGRIEPEKGQMEFVDAVRLIAQDFPGCRFFIIGAPMFSNADYYNTVLKASQGLPIKFLGWQQDASEVFSWLDLLAVPSMLLEATTRVILEAFAAGVPVVALPSGGIPEIVKNNETGFLATRSTAKALAERIASVLRMPRAAIFDVAVKARTSWKELYTLERYQQQVCDLVARTAR